MAGWAVGAITSIMNCLYASINTKYASPSSNASKASLLLHCARAALGNVWYRDPGKLPALRHALTSFKRTKTRTGRGRAEGKLREGYEGNDNGVKRMRKEVCINIY